jgi:hypothetical protein
MTIHGLFTSRPTLLPKTATTREPSWSGAAFQILVRNFLPRFWVAKPVDGSVQVQGVPESAHLVGSIARIITAARNPVSLCKVSMKSIRSRWTCARIRCISWRSDNRRAC